MFSETDLPRVVRALPVLRRATPEMLRTFQATGYLARIPVGREVGAIPLLLSGTVRVYQIGETGREVTLYRFRPGESCVLTANAILTRQSFPAVATVEEDAEAVMVPAETFRRWVARDDLWRGFFVDLVAQRLASVMSVVDEVAFRRLDERVAALLAGRARSHNPIGITHQEIAGELGSAREAVSRVLEDFGAKGWIRTSRGHIRVTDPEALERAAAG